MYKIQNRRHVPTVKIIKSILGLIRSTVSHGQIQLGSVSSPKRVEIITRCNTLILVTGLTAKHCNHPNYQMESYRSLHRSYENKTNSFFKSQIRCLLLISLLIYQLQNKTFFSKVNRSTWHQMSVITSLNGLKGNQGGGETNKYLFYPCHERGLNCNTNFRKRGFNMSD